MSAWWGAQTRFLSFAKFENFGSQFDFHDLFFSRPKMRKTVGFDVSHSGIDHVDQTQVRDVGSESEEHLFFFQAFNGTFALKKWGRTFVTDRTRSLRGDCPLAFISPTLATHSPSLCATQLLPKRSTRLSYGKGSRFARSCRQGTRRPRESSIALHSHRRSPTRTTREPTRSPGTSD